MRLLFLLGTRHPQSPHTRRICVEYRAALITPRPAVINYFHEAISMRRYRENRIAWSGRRSDTHIHIYTHNTYTHTYICTFNRCRCIGKTFCRASSAKDKDIYDILRESEYSLLVSIWRNCNLIKIASVHYLTLWMRRYAC